MKGNSVMIRNGFVMAVVLGLVNSAWANERFFVEAEGTIGGKPIALKCERMGMKASREMGDNFFPSPANRFRSYQFSCMSNNRFAGASVKFRSDVDPTTLTVAHFNGTGPDKTWELMDSAFTVRLADGNNQLKIHSFMNSEERNVRQHYTGSPTLKITEWKREVEGEGKAAKAFHIIGGEVTAQFEEKVIQGKEKGLAGALTVKFRTRVREVLDPGAPLPAWPKN